MLNNNKNETGKQSAIYKSTLDKVNRQNQDLQNQIKELNNLVNVKKTKS